jgi:serine protease Do
MASAVAILAAGGVLVNAAQPENVTNAAEHVNAAHDYTDSYWPLVKTVLPAVVNVSVDKVEQVAQQSNSPLNDPQMQKFFERFFGQQMPFQQQQPKSERLHGEGSGFVIDPAGYIVTNAHVAGGADKIMVSLQDGQKLAAKLVGIDKRTDLALLKVDAKKPLPFLEWGDSSAVHVGDKVLAIGNPFGLGGTVTSGIISATKREIGAGPYDNFLQIDASINPGNSGGPTIALNGKVIGIDTLIYSPSGGSVGIGFAIASNEAQQIIQELKDKGSVERGWLGVGIQSIDQDIAQSMGLKSTEGALVTKVEPDSPAASAGLHTGDVITKLDGKPITTVRELSQNVANIDPGSKAAVTVLRDGKEQTLEVAVGKMPSTEKVAENSSSQAEQPRLGLSLAPLTPDERNQLGLQDQQRGVLVQSVVPNSPAESKGLQAGDVILRVGDHDVRTPQQAVQDIQSAHKDGRQSVLLLVWRDDSQLFMAVPFAVS